MIASAPGKLIVLGEYAVLDPARGGDAVVVALDRRARARALSDEEAEPLSPFLERAEELVGELAPPAAPIRVDTSTFRSGAGKLGLGSSAAATVAYVAARLHQSGAAFDRELIHRLAHTAHAEVQEAAGALGSGVDIAAAVHGGWLAARVRPDDVPSVTRFAPTGLHLVAAYSGEPASTTALVAAIGAFARADPEVHGRAIDAIAAAARAGIRALEANHPPAFLAAVRAGFAAIDTLGRHSGVRLVTDTHREIAHLAATAGGVAKPTGAGGGDTAAAFFTEEADASRFRGDLMAAGIDVVDAAIDQQGVAVFADGAVSSG